MEVKVIGVVGAGQMGSGIAQVAAVAGYGVVLVDVAESFLERGLASIRRSLGKFLEKGRITPEAHEEALGRESARACAVEDLKEADLIVEAIVEDEGEKRRLFERLGALAKPEAGRRATPPSPPWPADSGRPQRFIGMHFFIRPAPSCPWWEVIREATAPETGIWCGAGPADGEDPPGGPRTTRALSPTASSCP
ncbi:MAG: 3-hydroxyacyl-CoA dehydrogenase NAD-binding domain-containing protein [Thermus sp.]